MTIENSNRVAIEDLTPFEINVIEVALTHLREMHEEIINEDPSFSGMVIETCESLLKELKEKY